MEGKSVGIGHLQQATQISVAPGIVDPVHAWPELVFRDPGQRENRLFMPAIWAEAGLVP